MRVIRGSRVVLPDGERPADVAVESGTIVSIEEYRSVAADVLVDAGDLVVSPGLVDTHVHVNEPGRTRWEGFETATLAAAAGGITTIVDMPLNSIPPTCDPAALDVKRAAARDRVRVDVGFWGGLVPGNDHDVEDLAAAGVLGFKAFLVDSGVEEFPPVTLGRLRRVLPVLGRLGMPTLVHAESPRRLAAPGRVFEGLTGVQRRRYHAYLASRPSVSEDDAVRALVRLASETGSRIHVLHLGSGGALDELRSARATGVPISAETCPHYLLFSADEIPDGATEFKCAPPIREAAHREALWGALLDGTIDMVVSDHSPAPAALKALEEGDFGSAWGGISSLQLLLPAVWTPARHRGSTPTNLARWLSRGPAELAGLGDRKGAIAMGRDADLVVWDPDASFRVDPGTLRHRHPVSPYAGRVLQGVVRTTILRGEIVHRDGDVFGPSGRLLGDRR